MRTLLLRIAIVVGIVAGTLLSVAFVFLLHYHRTTISYFAPPLKTHLFTVQSIDTMKFSRDMAQQVVDNPASFRARIDAQVQLIADAGATHVAVATPYDARFLPALRIWVASARTHNLSVWFRGNFSGWEGWFEYDKIDSTAHKQLLRDFLRDNPSLFATGDVFTPCPECENGGPGDPRQTGKATAYNAFLVDEKKIAATEFALQDKYIAIYPSMNGDIARQIITRSTVSAFGGTILIDHYVNSAEKFASDIRAIPKQLNANVGLGEVGGPIPDLNGSMTQAEQATYVDTLFKAMYEQRSTIPVVNYWTLGESSTELINANGTTRQVYTTVQNYFKAFNVYGAVYNSLGESVSDAKVSIDGTDYETVADTLYQIFVPRQHQSVTIQADGYTPVTLKMPSSATTTVVKQDVRLDPIKPDWWYQMREYVYEHF